MGRRAGGRAEGGRVCLERVCCLLLLEPFDAGPQDPLRACQVHTHELSSQHGTLAEPLRQVEAYEAVRARGALVELVALC